MARKRIGRAFPITRRDVEGYGYARPRRLNKRQRRNNPGVTAIAAINGRGAFHRARSARAEMRGLSPSQRKNRARSLTAGERSRFAAALKASRRKNAMRRNKAPSPAQIAARKKFAEMVRRRAANRGRGGRTTARRRRRNPRPLLARGVRRTRRANKRGTTMRRRKRRKTSARRRRSSAKRTTRRRRRRSAEKLQANPRRRRRRRRNRRSARRRNRGRRRRTNARRRRSSRRRRRNRSSRRRRRSRVTRRRRKNRRSRRRRSNRRRSRRRRSNRRRSRRRRSNRRRSRSRRRRSNRRRRSRASGRRRRRSRRSNRRHARRRNRRGSRRRRNGRRRYRRNTGFFKGLFRRNPAGLIGLAFVAAGGYLGGRLLANLFTMGVAKLGAAAPAATPAAAGLGNIAMNYAGVLGSLGAAALQIPLTLKFVEDPNTKQALVAGAVISAVQGIVVGLLKGSAPGIANMLSGDDTAAKLSAMYGLGQGTSIMPHYAPIGMRGMGEYFAPANAVGEYFSTPMGEYFDSGVEGLGNYTGNPDLFEAAAGYGALPTPNTNHVDPSSDLDRQLSIAEAAAGVGMAYEAAAGGYGALPSYEAQAGLSGGVATVPTTSTWIPGTSDPQIWAGARAVSRPQEATAETPAGILSTPGGAGILG